jgi:hypothetical protein
MWRVVVCMNLYKVGLKTPLGAATQGDDGVKDGFLSNEQVGVSVFARFC